MVIYKSHFVMGDFFNFVREKLPTPVFWPEEFHGLYSPWGCKELDMTERLSLSFQWLGLHIFIAEGMGLILGWELRCAVQPKL